MENWNPPYFSKDFVFCKIVGTWKLTKLINLVGEFLMVNIFLSGDYLGFTLCSAANTVANISKNMLIETTLHEVNGN